MWFSKFLLLFFRDLSSFQMRPQYNPEPIMTGMAGMLVQSRDSDGANQTSLLSRYHPYHHYTTLAPGVIPFYESYSPPLPMEGKIYTTVLIFNILNKFKLLKKHITFSACHKTELWQNVPTFNQKLRKWLFIMSVYP